LEIFNTIFLKDWWWLTFLGHPVYKSLFRQCSAAHRTHEAHDSIKVDIHTYTYEYTDALHKYNYRVIVIATWPENAYLPEIRDMSALEVLPFHGSVLYKWTFI